MSGLICAGNLYVDRFDDNGNSTGLKSWGNATKFAITESADAKTRTSKQKETYGQALDIVQVKKPTGLEITMDEITKDTVSAALLGTVADLTLAAGTVTAEPATAHIGAFIKTQHENISGLVVKSTSNPAVPFTLGEDYVLIDAGTGLIEVIGGSIMEGEALNLAYSYGADAGSGVTGGSKPSINCRLFLDGKNLATGEPVFVDVGSVVMAPKSAVDFLADTFLPLNLSGTVKGTYTCKLKTQPGA